MELTIRIMYRQVVFLFQFEINIRVILEKSSLSAITKTEVYLLF